MSLLEAAGKDPHMDRMETDEGATTVSSISLLSTGSTYTIMDATKAIYTIFENISNFVFVK